MAWYVTSDAHGHLRPLDRVLARISPGVDDTVVVLGDMVDRGPDPLGVIKLVRSLPNARVLMGNHERMMLDALLSEGDLELDTWAMNGGYTTAAGLDALGKEACSELVDWVVNLPLFMVAETAERPYILVHAGIDALAARGYLATAGVACADGKGAADASVPQLLDMLACQDPMDLLWIRGQFWGEPTGLVGADGRGPVVIAGHTPSVALSIYAGQEGVGATPEGKGMITPLGACPETGGVADRIDIDCAAAGGSRTGRIGVMRLDDGATWYEAIEQDE